MHTKIILSCLCLGISLICSGCAATPGSAPQLAAPHMPAGRKPALYIVIQRDQRLPATFSGVFEQISRQSLADFDLAIADNNPDPYQLAQADWVMTLRATRIIPDYTFQPSSSNALNSVNDSLWGSGLGVGLILAPSVVTGDEDFIEATLRDAQGNTLKTYQAHAAESGFFWPLILTAYVENLDEDARWRRQINALYQKMADDKPFETQP